MGKLVDWNKIDGTKKKAKKTKKRKGGKKKRKCKKAYIVIKY